MYTHNSVLQVYTIIWKEWPIKLILVGNTVSQDTQRIHNSAMNEEVFISNFQFHKKHGTNYQSIFTSIGVQQSPTLCSLTWLSAPADAKTVESFAQCLPDPACCHSTGFHSTEVMGPLWCLNTATAGALPLYRKEMFSLNYCLQAKREHSSPQKIWMSGGSDNSHRLGDICKHLLLHCSFMFVARPEQDTRSLPGLFIL